MGALISLKAMLVPNHVLNTERHLHSSTAIIYHAVGGPDCTPALYMKKSSTKGISHSMHEAVNPRVTLWDGGLALHETIEIIKTRTHGPAEHALRSLLSGRYCRSLPVEPSGVCCCACVPASSDLGCQAPRLVPDLELGQKPALPLPARPAQPAGCPQEASGLGLGQKPALALPAQPAGCPQQAPDLKPRSALLQALEHQVQQQQAHLPGFQKARLSQQPAHAGSHMLSNKLTSCIWNSSSPTSRASRTATWQVFCRDGKSS